MSRIVDRDRGRSVLMSRIVWCYLESLVTTRLRRAFHRISLSNQGQSRECGQVTRGLVRINDFYRVSHSRHHSSNHLWREKTIRAGNWGQNLFWIFVTGAAVYLFDTLCPGYWGDDLSCDRQYLGTRSQRAESGECQPHTSNCELISPDGDYVASKQWDQSYEAIGLTGDTLINTRLGK